MKRTVLFVFFSVIFTLGFLQASECQSRVQAIKSEISFLNLINGLSFSEDQVVLLLAKLDQVEKINADFDARYEKTYWEVQDHYNSLKRVLVQNYGIPKEMEMVTYKIDGKLHGLELERLASIAKIEESVIKDILTPRQIKVIDDFTACVIPPDNIKNPDRAGEMPDNGEYETLIDRMRKLNNKDYKASVDSEIAIMLKHIDEHHCVLSEAEKMAEKAKYVAAFDKARKMDSGDYMLKKEELAASINYDNVDHKWWVRKVEGQPGEVASYLLEPAFRPLFEERLARIRLDNEKITTKK